MSVKTLLFAVFLLIFSFSTNTQTFTNVGPQLGLTHSYQNGFNGGGISVVDFDGDGLDDIFASSSWGESVKIYRNNGTSFDDVTGQFGLSAMYESKTILCSDYDNDGDKDILIVYFIGALKLLRNDNGVYNDVTAASGITTDSIKATAAIWFDYDNDGKLDLYVGVYSGFGNNDPLANYLYRNLGNGTFMNVAGNSNAGNMGNKVLALIAFDYNNDRWQDIYVASDRRYGNTLMRNNGNGTFTDVSIVSGTGLEMDAMGLSVADYDGNGYFDIYVSNGEEGNAFLKNNGDGTFTEVAGILNMSVNRICWGNNFFDYDNDGDMDLYVAVSGGPLDRYSVLFRNNGNGSFTRATGIGLESGQFSSYGCAIGDYDNNGYVDVASMNVGDSITLWKNSGGANNWLKIKLQGTYSNRDGIGSVLEVWKNGVGFKRAVSCGQSYCSQNSMVQTIGLGVSTADSIVVFWPSGIRQSVSNIVPNQLMTIIESGVIGINNNNTGIPTQYNLSQNYPNPFNPSTVIEYSVPDYSAVSLVIYDILGNEVAVLDNSYKAPGNYSITLDSRIISSLSSGIYFYRLSSGSYSESKKMILTK